MFGHYQNGQNYPPNYNPNHQAHLPTSRPPMNSLHHQSSNTLPPLASSNLNAVYGSNNSQPSLLAANANAVSQNASFPVYGPTANVYIHNQSYSQPPSVQQSPQTSRPPSTSAHSQPQTPAYTSAPLHKGLPELAPRTLPESSFPSSIGNGLTQPLTPNSIQQPTHVVGSQGRRGVLPSLPGRLPVEASSNSQKGGPLPPKDAEGKFPCSHCNKTYLHAKHLKRHLLRHTGVRPYTCGLCTDTFSRSDILKRHFHKCSARRGNPTGENHLSHSRKHKKEQAERINSTTPTAEQTTTFTTPGSESFDVNAITALHLDNRTHPQYATMGNGSGQGSGQVSRAGSVKNGSGGSGTTSNRTSLGMVNTSGYDSANYTYSTGHATPDSAPASGAATPYTYPHEARNQLSPNGNFNGTVNGIGTSLPSTTSAPTSSSHIAGSLPFIAGQGNNFQEWPPSSYNHDDYVNGQVHSDCGPATPHHIKSEPEYSHFPFGNYPNNY